MANEENLQPVRSKKEARERGAKGGKKSGEVRREKKLMKEQIQWFMSLPLPEIKDKKGNSLKQTFKQLGIDGDEATMQMAVIASMFQTATSNGKNNVSAAEFLRDTMGEKPKDNVELNVDTSHKLKDVFNQLGGEGLSE